MFNKNSKLWIDPCCSWMCLNAFPSTSILPPRSQLPWATRANSSISGDFFKSEYFTFFINIVHTRNTKDFLDIEEFALFINSHSICLLIFLFDKHPTSVKVEHNLLHIMCTFGDVSKLFESLNRFWSLWLVKPLFTFISFRLFLRLWRCSNLCSKSFKSN